jgi:hypothetical protein
MDPRASSLPWTYYLTDANSSLTLQKALREHHLDDSGNKALKMERLQMFILGWVDTPAEKISIWFEKSTTKHDLQEEWRRLSEEPGNAKIMDLRRTVLRAIQSQIISEYCTLLLTDSILWPIR